MSGRNLAIIPARGGSKRIPHKNIREFAGRPILTWSVETARQCGLFEQIIVSTDDARIADIAVKAGALVPFLRSANTSDDQATIADALVEVVERMECEGEVFDYLCCVFATAPMMQPGDILRGLTILEDDRFEVVIPVVRFGYPIHRSLLRKASGALEMTFSEHALTRSQDLPVTYHDAGQWVWTTPSYLKSRKPLLGENTGSVIVDANRVEDIDTEEDWVRAEWKFERLLSLREAR